MHSNVFKIYDGLFTTLILLQGAVSLTYKVRSDEEKLLDYLFQDYNPSARPVLNSSRTVPVNIQFSLLQIQDLNVRSQILTTTGLLVLEWYDERLTWDNEINTLKELVIEGKKIWRPEFAAINGADKIYGEYNEFQAVIYPSGKIRWEPGGVFKTMCNIDITYYPFDEQKCDLIFGAWSYYTTKMNLTTNRPTVIMDTYEINGEWALKTTSAERREFHFKCCPHQRFSYIMFSVYIQRRHTFYIMNVILPGILTSTVLLSIFFCTPSQKIHIGVASLLSFRLFLLNVADTIPRTSDHVPLLGVYLTCTMAITSLALIATIFILNLYSAKEKPVPEWAKKIFLVHVARLLCMCSCACPKNKDDKSWDVEDRPKPPAKRHNTEVGDGHEGLRMHKYNTSPPQSTSQTPSRRASDIHPVASPRNKPPSRRQSTICDKKNKDENVKDWKHMAAVCDRLFFWLCLIFISITTLLLFHPLTTSRYFKIPIIEEDTD